jgi:hypothetical protein
VKSETLQTTNGPVKLLFIAGPTRSGSTILSNVLGQIDGLFHAGEVIEAWDRGRQWKCSCGELPADCPVWSGIFRDLDKEITADAQSAIIHIRNKWSRSHKVIFNHYLGPKYNQKEDDLYAHGLTTLYSLIKRGTGAEIIVDSSKNVGYTDTLDRIEALDLYVVHLLRDSRATAYSWSKKKKELWRAHPLKTSFEWSSRNIAAEMFRLKAQRRYLKIRYEDFITHPRTVVQSILNFVGHPAVKLPFIAPDEVVLDRSHGLCGNPGRYNRGSEKLRLDDRWKTMKGSHKLLTTMLTWPLLLRNNYRLL